MPKDKHQSIKHQDKKMGKFDSFDIRKQCFTLDKPLEAFHSQHFTTPGGHRGLTTSSGNQEPCGNAVQEHEQPGQRSPEAAPGPSCSFNETVSETSECTWILEEDNREENSSSFSGLDVFSPQLVSRTKTRPKRPRTRKPTKKRLNTVGNQDTTEPSIDHETPGPPFGGKKPFGDALRSSPRTPHTTRDSEESTSGSGTNINVRNLRARFEQI